ncbi:MAG: 2-nitropropane dioxygenase [Candidatus Puniceispirillum sp.]|nr:2-nitropropane dioxygenase [Candidatus Pelagibacter sp.]MBA4283345.1 2-nitropropane dioxygenase [Candidatus Puniceispirillum sp.]
MSHHLSETLHRLMKRGCDFLGCNVAIMGGAMTWVSNASLVSAISNSGGFGVIACGSMPPHLLNEEISKTRTLTQKPFGVNLIIMHPQLQELLDVCISQKVTHVVFAGGIPVATDIQKLKEHKIKIIGFAPSLIIAQKLERIGVDAIIIEGHEAGGHIGPVSTSVLAQEILPHIQNTPVFIAGGIGRGETMAMYLKLGASGVQLGSLFVCATESTAHPHFKKAFIRANSRDAIVSAQLDPRFPVIPVRAINNKGCQHFVEKQMEIIQKFNNGELSLKDGQMEIEHFWAGALRRAVIDGDVETGSLMAGQSVGLVKKEQPTQEIINTLIQECDEFLKK